MPEHIKIIAMQRNINDNADRVDSHLVQISMLSFLWRLTSSFTAAYDDYDIPITFPCSLFIVFVQLSAAALPLAPQAASFLHTGNDRGFYLSQSFFAAAN